MKAIIELDVPDYQIGQEVSIYFKDTMMIKAIVQEPCKDAIGREDMLDAIGHGTTYTSEELQRIIKGLPPVKPQPKMDLSELKRRILMEVDGGTDDRMLRYCDVCDRISDSIDKYQAESEDKYERINNISNLSNTSWIFDKTK